MFDNVNYSPEVANVLHNAIGDAFALAMTMQPHHLEKMKTALSSASLAAIKMTAHDPRKVAIGHALMAAESLSLSDTVMDCLFSVMEQQMDEMLDSDAVEVYERYEAYRQAERDELERMESESERNYLADLDAQREYNYELEQAIERGESHASLAAS